MDPLSIRISTITTHSFEYQPLYPEILRTCRRVWDEATPLLYNQNTFSFTNLEYDEYDEIKDPLSRLPFEARRACKELMSYDIFDWGSRCPSHRPALLAGSVPQEDRPR